MASALARTLIQDAVGGVTQMASLINCFLIIFVLLFIGPLFEQLPKVIILMDSNIFQIKYTASYSLLTSKYFTSKKN